VAGGSAGRITQAITEPAYTPDSSGNVTEAVNVFAAQPDTTASAKIFTGDGISYSNPGVGNPASDASGQFIVATGNDGTFSITLNLHLRAPLVNDVSCNIRIVNGTTYGGTLIHEATCGLAGISNFQGGLEQTISCITDLAGGDIVTFWLGKNLTTNIIADKGTTANFFKIGGGTDGGSDSGIVGTIMPFAGPSGTDLGDDWLFCDGSEYARDLYPDLSNALGTTYGGSDLSFNVPDLRGRTLYGELAGEPASSGNRSSLASFNTDISGVVGGATISEGQMPSHTHTPTAYGHTHTITDPGHTHSLTSTSNPLGFATISSGSSDNASWNAGGVTKPAFLNGTQFNTTFGIAPAAGAEGQTGVTNQNGSANIAIGYTGGNPPGAFLPQEQGLGRRKEKMLTMMQSGTIRSR